MAKRIGANKEPYYIIAQSWVDCALKSDGSLFTPGKNIWSLDNINSLDKYFVQNPIETPNISFFDKFQTQLSPAPDETIQLAAEMLYIYFLIVMSVKPETKREGVNKVLSWMKMRPTSFPDEVEDAYSSGHVNGGQGFNSLRPFYLWQIVSFIQMWKPLGSVEQDLLLEDPWKFKEFVNKKEIERAAGQRHSLLHLVHPNSFEDSISTNVKEDIAKAFSNLAPLA